MEVSKAKQILEYLNKDSEMPGCFGQYVVPPLLDCFQIHGPNGTYRCLVSKPAHCSLRLAKEASTTRLLPLRTARVIVAQLISGINYLHIRGIVHAGE